MLEGVIHPDETVEEGPFGEFVGYLSPAGAAPVFEVTAVTHRDKPIYQVINGYSFETTMLRKYVLEASLLKVLQAAVPIVVDAEMTAGGLHRFHAVLQVRKVDAAARGTAAQRHLRGIRRAQGPRPHHRRRRRYRYPQSARCRICARHSHGSLARIVVMPGARGHEYVRIGHNGIRAKVGIDATVPVEEKPRFRRCEFADVDLGAGLVSDPAVLRNAIGRL